MGGDAQEGKDEVGGWLDGKREMRCKKEREKCNVAPFFLTQFSDGRTE